MKIKRYMPNVRYFSELEAGDLFVLKGVGCMKIMKMPRGDENPIKCYNAIELETGVPLSCYDAEKVIYNGILRTEPDGGDEEEEE